MELFKLPTYKNFLLEKRDSDGFYTYDEMYQFLMDIRSLLKTEQKSYISIPYSQQANKTLNNVEDIGKEFKSFYKKYKSENPKFYIERFGFDDKKLNKKVKRLSNGIDIYSLLKIAKENTNALQGLTVFFTSDDSDAFAKKMTKDKNLD